MFNCSYYLYLRSIFKNLACFDNFKMPKMNGLSVSWIILGALLHVKLIYASSNGHDEEEVSSDVGFKMG